MRILLVTQHFAPEEGAHAMRWTWLAEALTERGHTLDVVVPYWSKELARQVREQGVTVHRIKPMIPGFGILPRLANEALTGAQSFVRGMTTRPDVVIATVPALTALPIGWALARHKHVPLVLDLRDPWPELMENWREWGDDGAGRKPVRRKRSRDAMFRGLAKAYATLRSKADAVVVTTESFAEWLRDHDAKNVHVVRNSIPVAAGGPISPVDEHDEFRVLYLGNVGRSQYLATAVQAVALCRDRGVDVRLRIVGHGAQEKGVQALARRIAASVEFLPRVPRAEAACQYEWCDTVLVSLRNWSQFERTVPSKLYDALWTGRHVSGSVTGEAAAIIREAAAGDVVPPQDPEALAALWADLAADRSRLAVGGRGREWVREHASRASLGNRYADVLEDLLHD